MPYTYSHAVVMKTGINGRHLPVASLRVHHPVIVGKSKQAGSAHNMAGYQGDSGKWKVQDGRQQRIEAVAGCEGISIPLIKIKPSRKEFGVVSSQDHGACCILTKLLLYLSVSADELLAGLDIEPIFRRLVESDDEYIAFALDRDELVAHGLRSSGVSLRSAQLRSKSYAAQSGFALHHALGALSVYLKPKA